MQIVRLDSYPEETVYLGSQVKSLLPRSNGSEAINTRLIHEKLRNVLADNLDRIDEKRKKLVLVLPDKTRLANASNIAVDVILALVAARNDIEVSLLYGLGSHPLMGESQIIELLNKERWQRIIDARIEIHQQTTKSPLPFKTLEIEDFDLENDAANQRRISLALPRMVWESHLIIVAGDTDLHPYEKRCGSGGLNKMLVIGLGNSNAIDRTHAAPILLDAAKSETRSNNQFVQLLDYYYGNLVDALMNPMFGKLKARPIGFSVIKLATHGEPNDYWIGDNDRDRARLTRQVTEHRICILDKPVNTVICDSERLKATDILAGARALHSLCSQDSSDNVLLCGNSRQRMAVLINPCIEKLNHGGIGNSGTLRHLSVLEAIIESSEEQAIHRLRNLESTAEAMSQILNLRGRILRQWSRHFDHISRPELLLKEVRRLGCDRTSAAKANLSVPMEADRQLLELECWAKSVSLPYDSLVEIASMANHGDAFARLSQLLSIRGLNSFSEGGQRPLRLLSILQKFERLIILTDNRIVSSYIAKLCPDLIAHLPIRLQALLSNDYKILGLTSLGISCISLEEHSAQQAIDICLSSQQAWIAPHQSVSAAFIQKPVIIRSRQSTSMRHRHNG